MNNRVIVVNEEGEIQKRIKPVSPREKLFTEGFLQKLLFNEPKLLPSEKLDSDYSTLIPLGREISVKSGSIDVLYLTPEGRFCIVETKLWRNPDAHRTVVAQIIDYAKDLSTMTFVDLCKAITKEKTEEAIKSFFKTIKLSYRDFNEIELQSNIQESLMHGRFLLLIVGDKIYPEVLLLTEAIYSAPHLEFNLSLAELNFYHLEKETKQLLVVPRVVGRTLEKTRAVVKIYYEEKKPEVEVTSIEPIETTKAGKTSINEFTSSMPEGFSDIFVPVYEDWVNEGYLISWGTVGFTIRYNLQGKMKTILEIYPSYMSIFTDKWCRKKNLPPEICKNFQNEVKNISGINRIISENRVYIYYKDISIGEYSKMLSQISETVKEIFDYYTKRKQG